MPYVGPSKFNPSVGFLASIREVAGLSGKTTNIRRAVRGSPQHLQGQT